MTPQKPQENQLLDQLIDTPKDDLEKAASLAAGSISGSTLVPVYSRRTILCYSITESEIRTFGFSSLLSTGLFSSGSVFLGFGLDIVKDRFLSNGVSADVSQVAYYAQTFSLIIAGLCFIGGILTVVWRSNFWKKIKSEQPK